MGKIIFKEKFEDACPRCGGIIVEIHYKVFLFTKKEFVCQSCKEKWTNIKALEREIHLHNAVINNELPNANLIGSSIILKKNEQPHWGTPAHLREEKEKSKFHPGSHGITIQGVSIGGSEGYIEDYTATESIFGYLILTNQRLIFEGDKCNRVSFLKEILTLKRNNNEIHLGVENRSEVQIFKVDDPELWEVFIKTAIKNENENQKR